MENEKETPWFVRLVLIGFEFFFLASGPFFIVRIGDFIYSDDFFWQSENRIYVMVALVFLYAATLFFLLFKLTAFIRDKKSEPAPTGLNTSVRNLLNHNKLEDLKYYDEAEDSDDSEEIEDSGFSKVGPSPTRMKKYMDEIVERERNSLDFRK